MIAAGGIVIIDSITGTITAGSGESVTLQCSLEGAQPTDNIQYQWNKDGGNIPSGIQTNGG